jgi:subtilisin family serine protease
MSDNEVMAGGSVPDDEEESDARRAQGEAKLDPKPSWDRPASARESTDFSGADELTYEQEPQVMTQLDPQLQRVILEARSGRRSDPALVQEAGDGSLRVDVLAVLRDPSEAVPGLEIVRVIGDVVTGSCDVADIETVRTHPNVVSLKGATRVEPQLHFSVPEIRGTQDTLRQGLPAGARTVDGAGVIVGIVDFGCDFVHRNFRRPDGKTRLLFLWDQGRPQNPMSPAGFPYGREFSATDINNALASPNPFQFLSYRIDTAEHGTHVMDIAAGNGSATGAPGVAPKADIIFVQLAVESLQPTESFGNSRRVLEAVEYIFQKAKQLGRSAVVNLSLGTHGGPHDGSTPVERGFDYLLEEPGRAIVISAGNSFQRLSHVAGRLMPGQQRTLGWETFSTDITRNELEIWYSGSAELEVTVIAPGGQRFGPTRLGGPSGVIKRQGVTAGEIIHRANDPLNGDNVINIFLDPILPSGVWGVELRAVGASAADFHAWIERDDDRRDPDGAIRRNQSKFVAQDATATHTLGSISCGKSTIVVGSYDATILGRDLSPFSSSGPTRDGKQKPEVSAPGQAIRAANSLSNGGTTIMSGTSMAAPHVAGLVALLMSAAAQPLSNAVIRNSIITAARRTPPPGNGWHQRYGNGRIDCLATALTQIPAGPQPSPVLELPTEAGVLTNGKGKQYPLGDFLYALLQGTPNSKVRVKFELEIEPLG